MMFPAAVSKIDAADGSRTAFKPLNDEAFDRLLTTVIPPLRAFARPLAGDRDIADYLAPAATTNAFAARANFQLGSNVKASIFRIPVDRRQNV